MLFYSRLFALLCFISFNSIANADTLPQYNQINLQANATQEVDNDQLVATLFIQETGLDTQILSNKVNKRMAKLLKEVKKHSDIKAKTMRYNTRPLYKNNKISQWQTSQTVSLTSLNIDLLADLVGKLGDLASVQSLTFGISAKKADDVKQQLTIQAITNFKNKAQLITHEFGGKTYKLVNVNVNGDYNNSPQPYMKSASRMMSSESLDMAPALEAGTNVLRISVNGSIELVNK